MKMPVSTFSIFISVFSLLIAKSGSFGGNLIVFYFIVLSCFQNLNLFFFQCGILRFCYYGVKFNLKFHMKVMLDGDDVCVFFSSSWLL